MSRPIFMNERSDERADYEYDRRREERAEERARAQSNLPTQDQTPASATPVPTTCHISQVGPDQYSIGCHLRTAMCTGKQFNTPAMRWPEIEAALREWRADPAEFYMQHFDWSADAVQATLSGQRVPALPQLTLADLGL